MKVILSQKVEGVGEAGTVKDVADGYARNFLLPRHLAVPATEGALKKIQEQQAAEAKRQDKIREDARAMANELSGKSVVIRARVGEQDRLYGSVTSADIAEAISSQLGKEVDKRKVELEQPIHSTGTFEVPVKFGHDVVANVSIVVEPEQ